MAGKLAYERYYWFHGRIRANRYPNARILAERFEISQKQAQRDIEFMRDRLDAPLRFNPRRNGYEYDHDGYELPPVWFTEDELLAFCLAIRLSTAIPDTDLKDILHQFLEKFISFRSEDTPPAIADMDEKVSVKNIQYYRVNETIFHKTVALLFKNKAAKIAYTTPHTGKTTERIIAPLHLLCYMGSWHLIAFCTLRGQMRDFVLSRITAVEQAREKVEIPKHLPRVKDYIRKNFGVMSGNKSVEVMLRFKPEVSPWVSEQIWHESQHISSSGDGSILLRFPVMDFREVCHEILKFGSNVEVLSPPELRREIQLEIEKMTKIYR